MEVILKYNLPEENTEFKLATNAGTLFSIIFETLGAIRQKIKYDVNLSEEQTKAYEEVQRVICEEIESHGLTLDYFN